MFRKYLAITGIITALMLPAFAQGQASDDQDATGDVAAKQNVSTQKCQEEFEERLAQQERIFNHLLFGRHAAADEPINSVIYDEDAQPWLKTGENTWVKPLSKDEQPETLTDADIDETREWDGQNETFQEGEDANPGDFADPARRADYEGLTERQGVITSQLIPDMLQGMRALHCRASAVCEAVTQSFLRMETDESGNLRITMPGCRTLVMKPIEGCAFDNVLKTEAERRRLLTGFNQSIVFTQCRPLAEQMLDRNASLLRVTVSYDAAYRSLLQFSGSLDQFLWGFRGSILAPIEQTLPLLENLTRLPCFPAQCNA